MEINTNIKSTLWQNKSCSVHVFYHCEHDMIHFHVQIHAVFSAECYIGMVQGATVHLSCKHLCASFVTKVQWPLRPGLVNVQIKSWKRALTFSVLQFWLILRQIFWIDIFSFGRKMAFQHFISQGRFYFNQFLNPVCFFCCRLLKWSWNGE